MLLQVLEATRTLSDVAHKTENETVAVLIGILIVLLVAFFWLFVKYDGLNKETRDNRIKDQEIAMTMNNLLDKSIDAGTRNSDNIIKAIESSETKITHKLELLQAQKVNE